ncbi:MAG: hypothetical protein HY939_00825 [Gammaproteobacteria bacterium]|nr:hypothetical protein [Gammaproteobacteria bacterium]
MFPTLAVAKAAKSDQPTSHTLVPTTAVAAASKPLVFAPPPTSQPTRSEDWRIAYPDLTVDLLKQQITLLSRLKQKNERTRSYLHEATEHLHTLVTLESDYKSHSNNASVLNRLAQAISDSKTVLETTAFPLQEAEKRHIAQGNISAARHSLLEPHPQLEQALDEENTDFALLERWLNNKILRAQSFIPKTKITPDNPLQKNQLCISILEEFLEEAREQEPKNFTTPYRPSVLLTYRRFLNDFTRNTLLSCLDGCNETFSSIESRLTTEPPIKSETFVKIQASLSTQLEELQFLAKKLQQPQIQTLFPRQHAQRSVADGYTIALKSLESLQKKANVLQHTLFKLNIDLLQKQTSDRQNLAMFECLKERVLNSTLSTQERDGLIKQIDTQIAARRLALQPSPPPSSSPPPPSPPPGRPSSALAALFSRPRTPNSQSNTSAPSSRSSIPPVFQAETPGAEPRPITPCPPRSAR